MSKKKRLGRGLEALLGVGNSPAGDKTTDEAQKADSTGSNAATSNLTGSKNTSEESPIAELDRDSSDSPTILPFRAKSTHDAPIPDANLPTGGEDEIDSALLERLTEAVAESDSEGSDFSNDDANSKPGSYESEWDKPQRDSGVHAGEHGPDAHTQTLEISVYDIDDNPFQPRREFNKAEIESLAESLKAHDQLQSILVRRVDDRYQLISGERRLRAAIHAGWSKIQAQVREADDRLVAELAIVENLQRKDLNPIEKALSFRRYLDEHHCPQEELANRLKIDRSTVTNLLRLLELPQPVQKALQVGLVSNGHARALLPLGEEHLQIEYCNRIQREGLSVRAIEQMVREKIQAEDGVKNKLAPKGRTKSGQILSLEKDLKSALGTKVEINASSRGKGKIVVHYSSREEFERLRQIFADETQRDSDVA